MTGLIPNFPADGVVTVNRVILKPQYSIDDLQERVALLCENVKTSHSDSGFVGGFVALNSGEVSNEGSTIGQPVGGELKDREALIVTFWRSLADHEASHRSETFQPLFREVLALCENGNEEIAYDMLWSGAAYSPAQAAQARAAKARHSSCIPFHPSPGLPSASTKEPPMHRSNTLFKRAAGTGLQRPTARRHRRIERHAQALLARADIRLNGDRPWDLQLHHPRALQQALGRGNLGLGESYVQGDWEAEALDEFFHRLLSAGIERQVRPYRQRLAELRHHLFNLQTRLRAWQVGQHHYDLQHAHYAAMLDPRFTYTCGHWATANDLNQAQEAKLEMVCRKLDLRPGQRLLDIGCGWGSLLGHAAERHGVEGVGITISRRQAEFARERYARLPIEIRLCDYRDLNEPFDAIASLGMFEHVGRHNHRTFMRVAHRCLRPGGRLLLHTIGKNCRHTAPDPWIDRYIFPNGDLPSAGQIADAADDLFVIEDVHNFGVEYDRTLMTWWRRFEAAWPRLAAHYPADFYRTWRYYLHACAGAFRARNLQLWQWLLVPGGLAGGYRRETAA